jgi:hypothetical protein
VFVRLSNSPATAAHGTLTSGRTYPATAAVNWPLDDAALGGSTALGSRRVYAQWRDVAGHWSGPTTVAFNLDACATATVTIANGRGYATGLNASITVAQAAGRAIGRVISSTSATTIEGVLAASQDLVLGQGGQLSLADTDAAQHVYVQWQDINGCWSAVQDVPVTLDRLPPAGSLSIADGASASLDGNVQLLAPATDAGSGVAALELSNDGTRWTALPPSDAAFTWSAGAVPDGPWTVSARWRDVAGNLSATQATTLTLRRNGPSGTFTVNGGATFTNSTTVQVAPQQSSTGTPATAFLVSNDATLNASGALANSQSFATSSAFSWTLSGTADGPRTIYGQWRDGFGRLSSVVSASITLDRTAPLVATPYPRLVAGTRLTGTSVPIRVTGQATDSGSGVSLTTTESSRNGGSWIQVGQGVTVSDTPTQIDTTGTWQLRTRAIDATGNASVPATSRAFRAIVTEDTSKWISYSGKWTKVSASSASGGTTRRATAKGATATLSFTGSSVAWVAPTSNKSGVAKVFIDGLLVTKVDLGAVAQSKLVVFAQAWSAAGKHTIKIKVQGTSGRARVDLDAFIVLS